MGFTLVETLVAVSIFTLSVLAMISVLGEGISDTGYARKKITAIYLAQEGIETIRNMRDTYVLYSSGGSGWPQFRNKLITGGAQCDQPNGCYFDDQALNFTDPNQPITNIAVNPCGSNCPQLLFNSVNGEYNYTTGSNSGFIREIHANTVSGDEMEISVTVFWTQESGTYSVTLSENLYNWVE